MKANETEALGLERCKECGFVRGTNVDCKYCLQYLREVQ